MDELPPLFAPGQRLGRYELLRRLAVGGMAEVYLAYSVGPGDFRKVVAIKRLLPQHALDPQLLRMFLDEARLMARLSHPHIPHVTDVDDGAAGDVPYFVMEYIHGTDLRGVLNAAGGPLPFEHALEITSAVAAGLHHAHEHRGGGGKGLEIVHRDVSPSNILISFDGAVKITDFGVAKWTEQKSFTHQGQLKGKFAHMSPEQCRGETLDRRSDVFALGTLLYEMATGNPPFVAESEYELLTQIVSRDVTPPRRAGAVFPAQLESIVMRSLRRDRNDRYPTTQALQLDLEAFAREHRLVVSPVALAGYLESLFGAQVTEWREALASGRTLADHLGTTPVRAGANLAATADGQSPALAPAPDRTATDTFARLPGQGVARGAEIPLPLPLPLPTSTGPASARHRRAKVTRAVAVTVLAVAAFALVLVATEMTSRWQRASQVPPIPLGMAAGFATPAPPLPPGKPPPGTEGFSSNAGGQDHELHSVQSSDSRPAALAARAGRGNPADQTSHAPPTAAAPSSTRRGRDTGLRLARRESVTGTANATRFDDQPVRADSASAVTGSEAAAASASAGAPAPVAPIPRGADAPPSPVKVWDPDSPVPP